MPNRLTRAAAHLQRRMSGQLFVEINIKRGGITLSGIKATPGKTPYEVETQHAGLLRVETRDYLIAAEDYAAIDSESPLPKRGDCIEEMGPDGVLRSHEVAAPVDGESVYRWMDQTRTMLRVHTVRVNELRS